MTYVALLRAVNLGGHNRIAMAALRDLVASLGFAEVRTLLQSGNVVFRAPRQSTSALEATLQTATADRLGVSTPFVVRTAAEWRALVATNPFPDEAADSPNHLLLAALRDRPAPAAIASLEAAASRRERVRVIGREAFIVYADGIGRSRLTNAVIERTLRTVATGRNWNTVLKLAALAPD